MEYDKRIKNLTALVIILTLMLLGCGVYIAFTRVPNCSNENVTIDNEITDKANTILNKISNVHEFLLTDTELNDMPNQLKLDMAVFYFKDDKNGKYIDDYTSDEILSELKSIFGKDYSIKFENIEQFFNNDKDPSDPENDVYIYNNDTKKYTATENGQSIDSLLVAIKNKLVDYKVLNNDEYLISYKELFYSYDWDNDGNDIAIFYNANGDEIFQKKVDLNSKLTIDNSEFNKYIDKLNTTEYLFKLEDDNLILKKFTIK